MKDKSEITKRHNADCHSKIGPGGIRLIRGLSLIQIWALRGKDELPSSDSI